MIAVSQIGGEVRIRPVRSDEPYDAAVPGDSVELAHNGHRIANMFDNVTADDFVEFVIGERIGQVVEVVDNISGRPRIDVHPDRARDLVCAATYIEDAISCR
jgi:hypothetical protein